MSEYLHADNNEKSLSLRDLARHLWPYLLNHKRDFFMVVASMLGLVVVGRALPFLFGYAIDHGIVEHDRALVVRVAAWYLAFEIVRAFLTYLHSFLFIRMGNQILFEIRARLIDHVQAMPIRYFDRTPVGRVVTRMTNDVLALGEIFTEGLILVFTSSLNLLAILVAMLWISPKLTALSLAIVPLMVWIVVALSRRLQNVLRVSKRKLAAINAFVSENLSGMKVLQLHNRTSRNGQRFAGLSREYTDLQLQSVHYYALLWPAMSFFFALCLASALYFGADFHSSFGLPMGLFIAFVMNVQDFFPPLRTILEKYQQFQNSLTSAERVFTLLDDPIEFVPSFDLEALHLRGLIEFRGVSFRYGPQQTPAIDQLSFTIQPGESLALVGRTGSGKSTVISLLQRLYEPVESGEILVDGKSLWAYDRRSLRARVGVVQQDNFIFRGTLLDNITLFNPAIGLEQVERAVDLSSCRELVRRLGGLQAPIEERGGNLSVGERQLIAFARVLAFDPDILILDEATANIDSQSEALIREATRQVTKGRTSIIVAHRLSTILECDQIMLLDQGHLLEKGSHRELVAKGGAYARLYRSSVEHHQEAL